MFDNLHGKARTITINDFSTLYTLFDHNHLLTNILWLLSKLSKNKGMGFISVGYNKAWWLRVDDGKFDTYSLVEVMEMIEYLIRNSYVKSLGSIFRQDRGMIMGGKSSGWLSDGSLMVDEFRYVEVKSKAGQVDEARRLENFCRYRDDCTVCNFSDFHNITSDIYPPSLSLTQENDDDRAADVLDMSVSINRDGSFVTKVYCKTDAFPFDVISLPFLDSNINPRLCYLVFYGQVLRYQRLCSFRGDFEDRVRILADELLNRGYNRGKLGHQFCRVIGKYMAEFQKWQVPINISNWFNHILTSTPTDTPTSPQSDGTLATTQPILPNPTQPDLPNQAQPLLPNQAQPLLSNPNNPIAVSFSQPTINTPVPYSNINPQPPTLSSSQPLPTTRTLRPRKDINYRC